MSKSLPNSKRHSTDKKKEGLALPASQKIEEFSILLLAWHKVHHRRFPWRDENASLYEQIIAEVLLQRTRADSVASFFPSFIQKYPSWYTLSIANYEELAEYLYPLGLWKRRAVGIIYLSKAIVLWGGQPPENYGELRNLPGVGQYIANAISLFAFGEPRPLLDINMARVLERYFGPRRLVDIRDDPYLQNLASKVVFISRDFKQINFAILDLAALICKRLPQCNVCPLRNNCKFNLNNQFVSYKSV